MKSEKSYSNFVYNFTFLKELQKHYMITKIDFYRTRDKEICIMERKFVYDLV
jgi:hypothetical protein